jgi:hypothetical protein
VPPIAGRRRRGRGTEARQKCTAGTGDDGSASGVVEAGARPRCASIRLMTRVSEIVAMSCSRPPQLELRPQPFENGRHFEPIPG